MEVCYPLNREAILNSIKTALQPAAFVHAMWEGGAAAFERIDQWSDIDLIIDVDDIYINETIEIVRSSLAVLSSIELEYRIPEPTWHGHSQVFYRLKDSGPYLLVDTVVLKHSAEDKFLDPGQHGKLVVHFDKSNVVKQIPGDPNAQASIIMARLETIPLLFDMFQILILKELNRKNWIEALTFYNAYTLRPLVELLRIRYKPERYNFSTRYVYYDLPADAIQKLENLYFIQDCDALVEKHAQAEKWFKLTLHEIRQKMP